MSRNSVPTKLLHLDVERVEKMAQLIRDHKSKFVDSDTGLAVPTRNKFRHSIIGISGEASYFPHLTRQGLENWQLTRQGLENPSFIITTVQSPLGANSDKKPPEIQDDSYKDDPVRFGKALYQGMKISKDRVSPIIGKG